MATGFSEFTRDEQDPKAVERVFNRINDLLAREEEILYIAIQKRPALSLLPDSVVCTTRRIFINSPGNLGLTMNYLEFMWKEVSDVTMKEEIFGAKITVTLKTGNELTVDFIPKLQARRVYRVSREALENLAKASAEASPSNVTPAPSAKLETLDKPETPETPETPRAQPPQETPRASATTENHEPAVPIQTPNIGSFDEFPDLPEPTKQSLAGASRISEGELSQKLAQLKSLFERQLITRDDYETKKTEILSRFL